MRAHPCLYHFMRTHEVAVRLLKSGDVHALTTLTVRALEALTGGRIVGARRFKREQWGVWMGASASRLRALHRAGLVRWDGDDLVIDVFPFFAEAEMRSAHEAKQESRERALAKRDPFRAVRS